MHFDGEFHKSIVDNLHDGVYYVDLHRRITYWNSGAERISGFEAGEVIGRRCADDVLNHTDDSGNVLCLTACPISKTLADGRHREVHVFLKHKHGERVPVAVRTAPIRDGSGRIVGAVEIFDDDREHVQTQQRIDELQRLALLDSVTGVGNRRFAEMTLRAKLEDLDRYGWPFGVLFVDLDDFKRVNDRYGHAAGDEALRAVARTLTAAIRGTDSVGRWGGDEFVAICPTADVEALRASGERVRGLLSSVTIATELGPIVPYVSVGGAVARVGEDPGALVSRADDAMYRSKQAGRDRVTVDDRDDLDDLDGDDREDDDLPARVESEPHLVDA
jgi:diguanylate cyclase (GGDEF)-like protein/PAS domain S-box-containing protein